MAYTIKDLEACRKIKGQLIKKISNSSPFDSGEDIEFDKIEKYYEDIGNLKIMYAKEEKIWTEISAAD
jgi:hypothetical protein